MKVPVLDNVLSSQEQEVYLTTSLDENSIEFVFQTDRSACVDLRQTYFALKTKLAEGRGFYIFTKQQKQKRSTKKTLFTETGDGDVEFLEADEGVPHSTHVNNFPHSIFSNAELYINNHQI